MNINETLDKLLATNGFGEFETINSENLPYCELLTFALTKNLRALPTSWKAIIISEKAKKLNAEQKAAFERKLNSYLRQSSNKDVPFVVVSLVPGISPRDLLNKFEGQMVFSIERERLIVKVPKDSIRDIPLVQAIRDKFLADKNAQQFFNPFTPGEPAEGWRFYGRKRELQSLIEAKTNYFIIGARAVGKTSLLKRIKLLLQEKGETVYFNSLESCTTLESVIEEILRVFDAKDLYKIKKRHDALHLYSDPASHFEAALEDLVSKSNKGRITLLLDELGNALKQIGERNRDIWTIIGVLRKLSHEGKIRVISTAFQEIYLSQKKDFDGPLVNFARTLRLEVLDKSELDEFFIYPLSLWGDVADGRLLANYIQEKFGTHPLILMYLGEFLFIQIFESGPGAPNVLKIAESIYETREYIEYIFRDAVEELYERMNYNITKYLYVLFCYTLENRKTTQEPISWIDHEWVNAELMELKITYDFDDRRLLLGEMQKRGLIYPKPGDKFKYAIASPIIYHYIKQTDNVERIIETYRKELIAGHVK
jgi:energy-coupling factor transporter ATP-binding protein EcfA2